MIALAVGCLLVGGAAACIAAVLRVRGVVAFVLAVGLLGAGEVVALSQLLSQFDAYERDWMLGAFVVVAAAACAAATALRPVWPAFPRAGVASLVRDRILVVLAAAVLLELLYLAALAVFTPPVERDALAYHLTRALFWIQRGSVGYVSDTADPRVNEFPVNAEILQGTTMLLSDSVRWVGLVQLGALVGAMVAVFGTARRIGMDVRQAAFGALLFATLPVVELQAPAALNDLLAASLVATAAFFVMGLSRAEIALACVAVALVVGTKGTALLSLPVLLALAVVAHRGRALAAVVAGGAVGVGVGSAWYLNNLAKTDTLFGTAGEAARGTGDGVEAIAARATRYVVEAFELPGAPGRDRFVYVIAAAVVLVAGFAVRRPVLGTVASVLALFPLTMLPLERFLHSVYWNGWEALGYEQAQLLGIVKHPTTASNALSWYGPVGLVAALVALALTAHAVRRRSMPAASLILASAPIAFLLFVAVTVVYFDLNGRFVMGGVALSAATWGVVQPRRAAAIALSCAAATTAFLALVNYNEKPSGIDLLEGLDRPSIWTLERGWSQSIEPEIAKLIVYADHHVPEGEPIAVARSASYPFAYAGYPGLEHRIAYADTREEATRKRIDWAVLPLSARCVDAWRLVYRSPPWGIYRRVPGSRCA